MSTAAVSPDDKILGRLKAPETFWSLTWRRFRKHRLAVAGGLVLSGMTLACLVVPLFVSEQDSLRLNFAETRKSHRVCSPVGRALGAPG